MTGKAAVLALAIALIVPAPADATVRVGVPGPSDPRLLITADGATDRLDFFIDRDTAPVVYVLESTQTIARSGTFCDPPTTAGGKSQIRCRAATPSSVEVTLAGGDDVWTDNRVNEPFTERDPVTVTGGAGADNIRGGDVVRETFSGDDGDDTLAGDGGADTLTGGTGDDRLDDGDQLPVANQDTLNGGSGDDTLLIRQGADTARGETGADEITSFDQFEATERPERDFIDGGPDPDVFALVRDRGVSIRDEGVRATLFTDSLEEETVFGVEGFKGSRAPDVINGALSTGTLSPFYDGRGGPDVLVGSPRPDVLYGGDGSDRLFGRDGNDIIDAKDGEPVAVPDELIDCGGGTGDEALIDLLDPDPVGCETLFRSAIGEGPHLSIGTARRGRRGAYAVRLRCPRALGHRCRGTLKLGLTRRAAQRGKGTRYSIRAGRRLTARVRLSGRGRRRRGFVRSVEKGDVAGRKTTLALRRLRPR